ncbi:Pr6Pr family membrane protein [Burkholderia alba]|uniref:Pr6Pr family membrane protein n=1 Tax=Burkholderia alba TaxID=2683677 RepID=UPI002B05C0B8|nr:Pr6Pr family membrane protein [Burkholderia alba]
MKKTHFVTAYRLLGCALILSATGYNLSLRWNTPGFRLSNFFSYFTQLSNLYAAAVLLAGAWLIARPPAPRLESARGAAVLYMSITGIVYELLLAHADSILHTTPPYTNWILHRIMPVVVLLDWLYVAPLVRLRGSHVLRWLAFPIAYLVYTLVRGPLVDWYPYPFVDPRTHGYMNVVWHCGAITLGGIAFAALVVWLGNRPRERAIRTGQA